MRRSFADFGSAMRHTHESLAQYGHQVEVKRWQGVDTEGTFLELLFHDFAVPLNSPRYRQLYDDLDTFEGFLPQLRREIQPNLPWADDHFAERVAGEPLNPGNEYKNWPHWRPESEAISRRTGQFSHTYMERFWPKTAGDNRYAGYTNLGIRYHVGDLQDVVNLLLKDPGTRQAYFPIWFPEDTGAVHGERVPCSIGYYFIMRNHNLHMRYHIRSCDYARYFLDDVYMAVRLLLWVLESLRELELRTDVDQVWYDVRPGIFVFDCDSLHVTGADFHVKSHS